MQGTKVGDVYDLEITETERRVLIDALTNHGLDVARASVGSPAHNGRGAPSADVAGGYDVAHEVTRSMSRALKRLGAEDRPDQV